MDAALFENLAISSSRIREVIEAGDIKQATAKTIEALNKLSLPAGVEIKIKASTR